MQVHKLRQEKDVLEGKLKDFERSLQKLKDCTYQEATQKREYERRLQVIQADLRGAHLREQVGSCVGLARFLTVCFCQRISTQLCVSIGQHAQVLRCDQAIQVRHASLNGMQELQQQVEGEAASARSERKKRENAERICKQAVEDKVKMSSCPHLLRLQIVTILSAFADRPICCHCLQSESHKTWRYCHALTYTQAWP